MIQSAQHVRGLANDYGICEEDIILIALNALGVSNDNLESARIRFYARLYQRPEKEFRLILSTGRSQSPFKIHRNELTFKNKPLAAIRDSYDDAAVIGYFRGNKDIITLNSNSRSVCTGCVFCPNTLESSSDSQLKELEDLIDELKILANFNGLEDLSKVKEVNLSTGCFGTENHAINHLAIVRDALTQLNCKGQIGMLTSVIRDVRGFKRIAEEIGDFHLIMTIECFERRELILKDTKASLTTIMMPSILESCKNQGLDTSFTYIVGLDKLSVMKENVENLLPHLTRFPNFQVYQPHDPIMDVYAAEGAKSIEFYLNARLHLEDIFKKTSLRPKAYSNYRPFWYFEFSDESLVTEYEFDFKLDDGHTPGYRKILF